MNGVLTRHPLFVVALFAPAAILVGVLTFYPFINGVLLSFTNYSPLYKDTSFIGFDNYAYLLEDPAFWDVVKNTLIMIVSSVVIATVLGFALALLLDRIPVGRRTFRALIFQGWIVPWVTVAVLWGWIFNADYGIINWTLRNLGLIDGILGWTTDPVRAQIVIVSGFVWRIIPFMMVMALAGLQGVPDELLDSARVDGAGPLQRLRHIILPLCANVMLVAALLQAVRLFQEITLPWVVTQGGPINATTTLSLYTYKAAFQQWDFGLASTVGILWTIALVVIASVYLKFLLRRHD
ncbi:MAG: sugar ABC transporter permease [Geminicoccaceae bacterium]